MSYTILPVDFKERVPSVIDTDYIPKQRLSANVVSRVWGYFIIPVFSVTGLTWLGSSKVEQQFNYSASVNFQLRALPAAPVGVNFCPCIRYRVGTTSFRYKLWENVGELLYVPLYAGQIIKKNFVIEVWSTNNSEVSLAAAIIIPANIVRLPTDFSTPDDIVDSVEISHIPSIITSTPFNFVLNDYWSDNT